MGIRRPARVVLLVSVVFSLGLAASVASAQTISIPTITPVGSGLQSSNYVATLSTGQHGGVTVRVESDDPSLVLVAPNASTAGGAFFELFVPNGSTNVSFVVQGMENVTGTAAVTVSAPGFTSGVRTATIVQPAFDIIGLATSIDTLDPDDVFQVRVGLPVSGNGSVSPTQSVRTGGPGVVATVGNSSAPIGQLITTPVTGQVVTVTIAPGGSTSPSSVAAGGVAFDGLTVGSTTVTATIPGFIATTGASVNVSVTQPTIGFTAIANVGAGLQGSPQSVSLSASQHGGVMVHIESADSSIALVAPNPSTAGTRAIDVFVANGSTAASFVVSGLEGVEGASLITASAPGFTPASQLANIQQPALDVIGLPTSIDTLDPVDPFQVRIGLPTGGQSSVSPVQQIRTGGVAVTATIVSSVAAVGDLVTTALTADTVVVSIPPGSFLSASTVAAGGVAFDGVSLGATTLSASIPGFIATTAASKVVTVTQPGISVSPIGNVGSGLQGGTLSITLGASQHGGVTVHVESANPSVALVSPSSSTAGSAFFDQFVPNGSTAMTLVVSGLESITGTSLLTVSAPGFVPTSQTATIVQPALDLAGLPVSIDTLDPNAAFRVRIGLAAGTIVNPTQNVRVGGTALTATIVHSAPSVADLVTTPLTADTVVVSIPVGSSASGATVAAGGVALDGVALGTTTVSAAIPGFIATTGASKVVTVTQPSISAADIGNVGAGLQTSSLGVSFSVSQHGGFTLHVESTNPTVARVAPNVSTPGGASFDVAVPNGATTAVFVVQGLDQTTGTADITLSAPGFQGTVKTVTIVQPALDLVGVDTGMDVADPDDPFQVRVGLPSAGNVSVSPPQSVRAGSPGLTATITLSNPVAGQLVTTSASGSPVAITIPAGASLSASTVAGGGVAFDPLAVGATLVSGGIPGFLATGGATQAVTVSSLVVTMGAVGDVGAGLQAGPIGAALGFAQHGGVTVHVASDNPSVALVSPDFSTPGTASIDFPLANGTTQVSFYVHGVATGTATITASAPTFTPASNPVNVVQPALAVTLLADSLLDNVPNDAFVVQVGIPTPDSLSVATAQFVRAGGAPLTATVSSSVPGVGALVTNTQSGSPVTVSIGAGESQSAASAAAGGVELDPVVPGTTLVSADIPGFIATAAASHAVTVVSHVPPTGVAGAPIALSLEQNVPNPFNPATRIRFSLPEAARVNVTVFDVQGRRVVTLVDAMVGGGTKEVVWNGRDAHGQPVGSGVYFCRLTTGDRTLTRKMVLLK